jgi:hypothetical protein
MLFGIALIIAVVFGAIIEWYVYDRAIYWHEDRGDPRNFPPPR